MVITTTEKRTNQDGQKKTDTKKTITIMIEEMNLPATPEGTMTTDQATTISEEEKKKIETMEDKTEDSTATKKIEEIEVKAETIE